MLLGVGGANTCCWCDIAERSECFTWNPCCVEVPIRVQLLHLSDDAEGNSLLGAQYRVFGLNPRFLQRTKKKRDFLRLLIEVAVVGFSSSELGEIEPTRCCCVCK